jgi:molybdopterin-guanine dinucleotide biosynthesis protein B
MKIFGVAGWRGSGKTTLVTRLLPELIGRAVTVSTMKHAHHSFDVDQPGKDSYEHRVAGATEVLITSASRWALMHEHRDAPEATFESLLPRMQPVDLLLVEGFKEYAHDKLEVHRPSVGKPLLCSNDPHVVAVASDVDLTGLTIPVLSLADVAAIADYIMERCELKRG